MRLTDHHRRIIREEIAALMGEDSQVLLFGNRLNDTARGGDIDLLVRTRQPIARRVELECKLAARLYLKLGGRKVDVLIDDPAGPDHAIYRRARAEGVAL